MKNKYLDWSKLDDLQKNQIEILLPNKLNNKDKIHCVNLFFDKSIELYDIFSDKGVDNTEATYEEFKASLFNPPIGDMVLVSNDLDKWNERIFLNEADMLSLYPITTVQDGSNEEFKGNKRFNTAKWRYMKPFIKEITKQEIQEKFNCTEFKIVE